MTSKTDSDKGKEFRNARDSHERELKEKGREIVFRTRGSSHGRITRLVSSSDLGQAIKPFVFLDYFDITRNECRRLAFIRIPGSRQ